MDKLQDQPTYGIAGACAYLRVSETSLKEYVDSGMLACSKPGREPTFRKQALEDLLIQLEIEQTAQRREAFLAGRKAHVQTGVSQIRSKRRAIPVLPGMVKAA